MNNSNETDVSNDSETCVFNQDLDLRYSENEYGFTWKPTVSYDKIFAPENFNDESHEMWLLSAPQDFNIQELHGAVINLEGKTTVKSKVKDKYEITAAGKLPPELENICVVTPTVEDTGDAVLANSWRKGFGGQLTVNKLLRVKNAKVVNDNGTGCVRKEKVPFPQNLKQRYVPYGSEEPLPISPRKRKKAKKKAKKSDENWEKGPFGTSTPRLDRGQRRFRDDLHALSVIGDSVSPESREKPKKRKSRKRELEESRDEEVDCDLRTSKKKKMKKKSRKESEDLEDVVMECLPSKTKKKKKKSKSRND